MNHSQDIIEIRNILRQKKIKLTLPRVSIYKIILDSREGLSAYDVEKQLIKMNSRINLSTIYYTLKLLYDFHLIKRYKNDENYTIYFIGEVENFIRIECKKCGFMKFSKSNEVAEVIKAFSMRENLDKAQYNLIIKVDTCEKCLDI